MASASTANELRRVEQKVNIRGVEEELKVENYGK